MFLLDQQGLEVSPDDHFKNGIRVDKWNTNYAWKKLREKVKTFETKDRC